MVYEWSISNFLMLSANLVPFLLESFVHLLNLENAEVSLLTVLARYFVGFF